MVLAADLLRVLPGGEWSSVVVQDDGIGMMAKRAVRLRAHWVRGDLDVFLKCIPSRRDSAGPETALLTEPMHLENIRTRLTQARSTDGPLVRLHRVEWIDNRAWLLIAMDPVQTLSELISSGGAQAALAIAVLRGLSVNDASKWFHFDICPSNAGVGPDGRVVLIDPESYLPIQATIEVSVPTAKARRVSAHVKNALQLKNGVAVLSSALARKKHNAEVMLLAAECCLGLYNRGAFEAREIEDWCAAADQKYANFWLPRLKAAAKGDLEDLYRVADDLERLPPSDRPVVAAPVAKQIDLKGPRKWEQLEPVRRMLRERRLTAEQIKEYRDLLYERAKAEPARREWWAELLMITLVYALDPTRAAIFAKEALTHHPGDHDFSHDRSVAERWRDA